MPQSPLTGEKYEVLTSVCGWNQSWVPGVLDPCVATSCQYIPFPPPHLNMRYVPDEENRWEGEEMGSREPNPK